MPKSKSAAAVAVFAELDSIADELEGRKIKLDNGATPAAIRKEVEAGRKHLKTIAGLEKQLGDAVDAKDKVLATLVALRKKARQGVRGKFGDDSDAYAAVGGTKTSERKKPGPRKLNAG